MKYLILLSFFISCQDNLIFPKQDTKEIFLYYEVSCQKEKYVAVEIFKKYKNILSFKTNNNKLIKNKECSFTKVSEVTKKINKLECESNNASSFLYAKSTNYPKKEYQVFVNEGSFVDKCKLILEEEKEVKRTKIGN